MPTDGRPPAAVLSRITRIAGRMKLTATSRLTNPDNSGKTASSLRDQSTAQDALNIRHDRANRSMLFLPLPTFVNAGAAYRRAASAALGTSGGVEAHRGGCRQVQALRGAVDRHPQR